MFNLNLNYRFVFESIYVKPKYTYIDYETRRYNKAFRHRENRIGAGPEVWEITSFQTPLPWDFVEINGQNEQGDRRNSRLLPRFRIPVATGIQERRRQGIGDRKRPKTQTNTQQRGTREGCTQSSLGKPGKPEIGQGRFREGNRHFSISLHAETFFRSLGAGYKRIRLTPKGEPSPQLLESAVERLQELDKLEISGHIDLFFGDESHVCTSGYVPYGWQFPDEKVSIKAEKCGRLNIFGMISRNNRYHGFTTTENINSEKFIEYMDDFTLTLEKLTVLVLDNASIHKSRKVKERLEEWKKRGLYIFFLPPYSPHLNLAETLWRILKGKWIKPEHYLSKETLFSAVQNILGGVGAEYRVRYSHVA